MAMTITMTIFFSSMVPLGTIKGIVHDQQKNENVFLGTFSLKYHKTIIKHLFYGKKRTKIDVTLDHSQSNT